MKSIIRAKRIITSDRQLTHIEDGFMVVEGGHIIAIGAGDGSSYLDDSTEIIHYEEKTVLPGFIDTHCFFTGFALQHLGVDLSHIRTSTELVSFLKEAEHQMTGIIVGKSLPDFLVNKDTFHDITKRIKEIPVIIFYHSGEHCWLNQVAEDRFDVCSGNCNPERLWRILSSMINQQNFIEEHFDTYTKLLNSRGVTSVKEMIFDDGYGLVNKWSQLESQKKLKLRIHFMMQPVSQAISLQTAQAYNLTYQSSYLNFSGFNMMTDGSISQFEGDLKSPYVGLDTHCNITPDYEAIKSDVLKADKEGFRFSLHAQGDAAVSKCVDIFSDCQRDSEGQLRHRHCITDLELTDPYDLERMGWLGITAEIYPQIPSLYNRNDKIDLIYSRIGPERSSHYWNRRKMATSKVNISCATDLPLLIPDIPESIFHACGGYFDDTESFNPENTLTTLELLRAWTYGGAYNLGVEQRLGSLEVGKLADFVVLDDDVLSVPMEIIRDIKVHATWLAEYGCIYQNTSKENKR